MRALLVTIWSILRIHEGDSYLCSESKAVPWQRVSVGMFFTFEAQPLCVRSSGLLVAEMTNLFCQGLQIISNGK